MRAMPPLYVLVWWSSQDQEPSVTIYDRYDDACAAYEESAAGSDVIAAAKVMEVASGGSRRMVWSPFDIVGAHRFWAEDKVDDATERLRAKAQVRREQTS